MTLDCVECVAEWLREQVKEKRYYAQRQKRDDPDPLIAPMTVYDFSLPDFSESKKKVPYIIVRPISGEDIQEPGNPVQSSISIRLILAVYNPKDDEQEGARVLQELFDFLRLNLMETAVIPDRQRRVGLYELDLSRGMSWDVYDENTKPFAVGWMEMTFKVRPIARKDVQHLI